MAIPLKTLSQDAIPRSLERADRYRLLNEPVHAESICLDILRIDPENQTAIVILILALTDQFGRGYKMGKTDPKEIIPKLKGKYEQAYYSGIIAEHRGKAVLDQNASHSSFIAHDFLTAAMQHYEEAADLRPAGNDDAILRWNTCPRLMNSDGVKPRTDLPAEQFLE